jgi:bacteriorhodopsin
MIAAVAYFSMGANLGWTGIAVEFQRSSPKVAGDVRQIFYVRYIDCEFLFPASVADFKTNIAQGSSPRLCSYLISS